MFIEDTYTDERLVTCDCGFDDEIVLALVSYGTVELSEWECPECKAFHEYRNDTIWDRVDEAMDRMREEGAW